MIFDFGPLVQFIEVTAQYSNAVLLAVVPHVSDFSHRLDLGAPNEFTAAAVYRLVINPRSDDVMGTVTFTNGYRFGFYRGHISGFTGPRSYSLAKDPRELPKYYGHVRMTKAEAVGLARQTITRLGIPLALVFADLDPDVTLPEKVGTNVVRFYELRWPDPRGGTAAKVEIDAGSKRVERLSFLTENLSRRRFEVGVTPSIRPDHPFTGFRMTGINPDYGYKLFPIVLGEVTNYATRLNIQIPRPLTTNNIKRFRVEDNDGWPHATLELTNGAIFIYRNTNVAGWYAPDEFWKSDKRRVLISDFAGRWRMTDKEIVALARQTIARLGHPKDFVHTETKPELIKPKGQSAKLIPRCLVQWMYPDGSTMTQWSYVEIDAENRQVKAVYFDDQSFWKRKPPIDIPISGQ